MLAVGLLAPALNFIIALTVVSQGGACQSWVLPALTYALLASSCYAWQCSVYRDAQRIVDCYEVASVII